MKRPILVAFVILVFSILACAKATPEQIRKYTATPEPTVTMKEPTQTPSAIRFAEQIAVTEKPILVASETPLHDLYHEISILAESVNVRDMPDGDLAGVVLQRGDTARAICAGGWCELEAGGFVWRGCTSDNPEKLGCEAR